MDVMSKTTRRLAALVIGIILVLGASTFALQVKDRAEDSARRTSDTVNACRAELRAIYLETPRSRVQALKSELVRVQAAEIEALGSESGLSAESDNDLGRFDGMTAEELRPRSAWLRGELATAQAEADEDLARHNTVTALATEDLSMFIIECERLTP